MNDEEVYSNAQENSLPRFGLRIYEGHPSSPIFREHFDTVTIRLDGTMKSSLDWNKEICEAKKAVEEGFFLMWDIDLGLMSRLTQPLISQAQFLSLCLSLEHFRDTVWQNFKDSTIGLSVYRGEGDFSQGFVWDDHQNENFLAWCKDNDKLSHKLQEEQNKKFFCRNASLEYIHLLASRLPDGLPLYLFFDMTSISCPFMQLLFLYPDHYERLNLSLKGQLLPFHSIGWGEPTKLGYSGLTTTSLPAKTRSSIAFCIPPVEYSHVLIDNSLETILSLFKERHLSFEMIPESRLTAEWHGLEAIFFLPQALTKQGKRMLMGFCAAGGLAVSLGECIGLSNELSSKDFFKTDFLRN